MTSRRLFDAFESIRPVVSERSSIAHYSVKAVPGTANYFVGKDPEGLACFLVSTRHRSGRMFPPIRLANLDAQFEVLCEITIDGATVRKCHLTVVRCLDSKSEVTRYFLSVCETILRIVGDHPRSVDLARAVIRLAAIFRSVRKAPSRSVYGLFGELYLILRSGDAVTAVLAWRSDVNSRFDFSSGDIRLEVKVTSGRGRLHTFSYDQCNPPSGAVAAVASLNTEQTAGGTSLGSVLSQVAARVASRVDLVLKLHETVAETLGTSFSDGLARRFDMRLAESSLSFFRIDDVPAIRGPLPAGVSDVRFRSDLSNVTPVLIQALIDQDPVFSDLLPIGDRFG